MNQPVHILLINTALEDASIAWSVNGKVVAEKTNSAAHEHAGFVQPAIEDLSKEINQPLDRLDAIAVINGPGSYTGLRVGLSSAKGICYALAKPLITINTLHWMAFGNRSANTEWVIPMIDARRMEVFMAGYNSKMECVIEPSAKILEEQSFDEWLNTHTISFVGNGVSKWAAICKHAHASFPVANHNTSHFAELAQQAHKNNTFSDLAYTEPEYTKSFHSTAKK